MNKSLKYTLIGVAVLIVVFIVLKKTGVIGGKAGLKVAIEKVQYRSITEIVSASGKVQPEVEVKISSDVSGEITALFVKEGQTVKRGDILCKIDPMIYESNRDKMLAMLNSSKANLSNANARLLQAQATFTNTEAVYNRNKKLFDQGAISQSDIDNSSAQLNAAKADLEALKQTIKAAEFNVTNAQASLTEANENIERTIIVSPVNGKISKLNIELGERVVGTSQMAGTELLRIAGLEEMEVLIDVNENDIVRVHNNDSASIEVDAYLGRTFTGVVTEIANSASNVNTTSGTDQVTNFQVKVRINNESYKDLITVNNPAPFRPGMSASVEIKSKHISKALAIPIQSVTQRTDTNSEGSLKNKSKELDEPLLIAFVCKDNKTYLRQVKTGIQDNNYIQITEGLKEGEEVVAAPYRAISKTLRNKSKVLVVDKNDIGNEAEEKE
jgi:HlyD family secretion protein